MERITILVMRTLAALAALFATCWIAVPRGNAQVIPVEYSFRKATVSLPVLSQSSTGDFQAVIKTDRLMTRQVINLARGRALKDKVPKNEILALALTPEFGGFRPAYLVVIDTTKIDKSQKPFKGQPGAILAVIGEMNSYKYVFGKPDGKTSKGYGTVQVNDFGNDTNGVTNTTLGAIAKVSRNRLLATGLMGDLNFKIDGNVINGIVAGGTFRSSGADLFTMDLELPLVVGN